MEYLEFEKPIVELENKLDELLVVSENSGKQSFSKDIQRMKKQLEGLLKKTFGNLTPWQVVQLARHPQRPHTRVYIEELFSDFEELHGDRQCGDDPAITAGVASFEGHAVAVIGHEKGDDTESRIHHNFGMPKPEGYRKAKRIFLLAEKFQLPIFTLIDTPGAYPGIDAEERNQSEAIAENLKVMSTLKTPVICTVIGEGGSGGALAVGVGDHLLMLQHSIYSVISPEGCASILWKDKDKVERAAAAMCITAQQLHELGLIDEVVAEPLGGAHRDFQAVCADLRKVWLRTLKGLKQHSGEELVDRRLDKIYRLGSAR